MLSARAVYLRFVVTLTGVVAIFVLPVWLVFHYWNTPIGEIPAGPLLALYLTVNLAASFYAQHFAEEKKS